MTPILIDPGKEFIDIELVYVEEIVSGRSKFHFIKTPIDYAKFASKGKITKLTVTWCRLTWKDQNIIYSRSMRYLPNNLGFYNLEFDGVRYRDLKLRTCLKKWNAVDNDGNPIPLSNESIDNLHPEVAKELLDSFEQVTEITEQELKVLEDATRTFFSGKYNYDLYGMPGYIYEHVLCDKYKWTLDYVRSLDYYDFQIHLRLCLTVDTIKQELVQKESDKVQRKAIQKGGGPVSRTITQKII